MADIFLSYRRQDSRSATGRLADRLEAHFGPGRVFRDQDSIALGDDFAGAIRRAVRASTVVLVIVGPDWLHARSADGARRLDDPADFVRLEIEAAFDDGVPVVPVLVEGAQMPSAAELPATLAAFARCQAAELSDLRWRDDAERLIERLQSRFGIESQQAISVGTTVPKGIGAVARFGLDLLELATHPTRLIARRQTDHALDPLRAFVFLLLCLGAANAALLVGFDGPPTPSRDRGMVALLTFLAIGILVGATVFALLAASLTLAWRLCGVRVESSKVGLILAYLYSGAWAGFCLGAMVLASGVQLGDAGVFDRLFGLLYAPDGSGVVDVTAPQRWSQVDAVLAQAFRGRGALPVALLGMSIWLATAVWLIVAWASFRHAFGVARPRAWLATGVWATMLGVLAWLAARIA